MPRSPPSPRRARAARLPPRREAARALLEALRRSQGQACGRRLRGPAAPRDPVARADRARRRLQRPLPAPDGRRVPGHQPLAAAVDQGSARPCDHGDDGRRRAPIDLRIPSRRPRRVPRTARAGRCRPGLEGDRVERELPLAAGGDRRGEHDRGAAARRGVPAPPGRERLPRHASPPGEGPAVEILLTGRRWVGRGGHRARAGDRCSDAARPTRGGAVRRLAAARARRCRS